MSKSSNGGVQTAGGTNESLDGRVHSARMSFVELCTCGLFDCCCQLTCTELRKLKEIEYDILHADVQGWEGEVRHCSSINYTVAKRPRDASCLSLA